MTIYLHKNDLPADIEIGASVAIDTEAMGLRYHRDRLCVLQLSVGNGDAHLIQFEQPVDGKPSYDAPVLKAIMADSKVEKIFHFARFDVAMIYKYLGVLCAPIYCTKIASKLCRTYTNRHGLKDLCRQLIGQDMSKQQQTSDWGAVELTEDQQVYAASDVLYLHRLKEELDIMVTREGRTDLARSCFDFLPHRALLDLEGWEDHDIFSHEAA